MPEPNDTTESTLVDPFAAYADAPTWVAWKAVPRENGKVDKVPINPTNGTPAITTDPSTWGTRAAALAMRQRVGLAGIGIVLHDGNDLSGFDLDNCYDPATGTLTPEAQRVVDAIDTYTEISPSGRGVKGFARAKLPEAINHEDGDLKLEAYSRGRFFTLTGQHLPGTPTTVNDRQGDFVLLAGWYKPTIKKRRRGTATVETIAAALDRLGYPYQTKPGDHGTVLSLDACVTSDAHDSGGYFVCYPDGTASYGCFHNSCADKGWSDAATRLGLPVEEVDPLPHSDEANAQRLIALHGRDWRYCAERKTDYIYDDRRWAKDRTGEIVRRAKDVGRAYLDALKADGLDSDKRKALTKWAASSLDEPRIKRMIALARVDERIAVTTDQLDRDPFLLNTPSGTVDLKTGDQRPHSRDDLITKMTEAPYLPWARSDDWERFLIAATEGLDSADGKTYPNPDAAEIRGFLQRLAGMSATGDASEEVAPFLHGPPASGKSTLVAAVLAALGDYALTTDFETFLKRTQPGGIRTDLVRLAGARMVASVEVEDGRELAAALFKRLTGGDTQTARGLYTPEIVVQPTQTYWLVANHAPGIDSADGAVWRRLLRVEFPHEVPPERRDTTLKRRLMDPDTCGAAILGWIVEGCLSWQRGGLRIPASVRASTERLREEMDASADFFADECVFEAAASVSYSDLWSAYQGWTRQTGERKPMTRPQFLAHLRGRKCQPDRGTGGVRLWAGVRLQGTVQGGWGPDTIIDLTNIRRPTGQRSDTSDTG